MYPCEHCGQPRDGKSRNDNSGPHDCIAALKQSLAAAEAARGIAEQQLTVICDGVNRRCNADNRQLPLVSLDRMLAAHKRDLTECRRLLREARDECRILRTAGLKIGSREPKHPLSGSHDTIGKTEATMGRSHCRNRTRAR